MLLRRNGEPFPPYREKKYKYNYVRYKKQVETAMDFINLSIKLLKLVDFNTVY